MPFQDEELPFSIKEHHFETIGMDLVREFGSEPEFEHSKKMAHFGEICYSWRIAVRRLNFGTPKNLKTESLAEEEELDLFYLALQHDNLAQVHAKYSALLDRRARADDKDFFRWVDRTIARRGEPNPTKFPFFLKYCLLHYWLHGFLWMYDNPDRREILVHVFQIPVFEILINEPQLERNFLDPAMIKKTVQRLPLKSWSNFRKAYSQAPCKFERWVKDPGQKEH
jgi:hypothetical protein